MKKSILILGIAFTFPAMALMAQPAKGGGGPGKPGPGGLPHGPGPSRDGDPASGHDDPHRNPLFHVLLHAIDTDGDGFISMTEMNHASEALLALDRNNDGRLSRDELRPGGAAGPKGDNAGQEKGDGKKGKGDDAKECAAKDGAGKDGNGKAAANNQPDEHRTALVDAIDKNHDGEIDASEIEGARAALKRLDVSHNGKLGPAEYGGGHAHP